MSPREARKKAKLSQQEMGDKLGGLTRQTVSRMEQHPEDMTVMEAQMWSDITGVALNELFFGGKL